MKTWLEFFQGKTDFSQIERIYKKANMSVDLARKYKPTIPRVKQLMKMLKIDNVLENISTIANLPSGAYGYYFSGENKKIIPPEMQKFIYFQNVRNFGNIPKSELAKRLDPKIVDQIKHSDTIHVNVQRILKDSKDDREAILKIASVIVHEAVHELEREATGDTNEILPVQAQEDFMRQAEKLQF